MLQFTKTDGSKVSIIPEAIQLLEEVAGGVLAVVSGHAVTITGAIDDIVSTIEDALGGGKPANGGKGAGAGKS